MNRTGLLVLIMFFLLLPTTVLAAEPQMSALTLGARVAVVRKPTHITNAGDGSGRLFITEQEGRIVVIKSGAKPATTFLDIRDRVSCCGERGLLSVVFPPGYRQKHYFYLNYTDRTGDTVVARYRTSKDSDHADPASEEVVLTVKQPFANHNGGQLAFGPDGYLYVAMGDGGSANDPFGNGQNKGTLLGKLLRIDVESDSQQPYAVPASNPFAGRKDALPEIWALGLRNPWRFSFDRMTGDLYIADVGQNKYEEVDVQPASSRGGENYGWNVMEGLHCLRSEHCDTSGLTRPVVEYRHDQGCSVTGGMVYRGRAFLGLTGTYLYGDYCSGRIWGLRRQGSQWTSRELAETKLSISTFGEDETGEVYVADYASGAIYRVEGRRP